MRYKVHEPLEFSTLLARDPFEHFIIFSFDIFEKDIVAVLDAHRPIIDSLLDGLKLEYFLLPFNVFFLHLKVRCHLVLLLFLFLGSVVHFLLLFLLFLSKGLFCVLSLASWFSLMHFVYFLQVDLLCVLSCINIESLQLMAFLKAFVNRLEYILLQLFLGV